MSLQKPQQTLLAVLPFPEPTEFVSRIRKKHSELNVVWVHQTYGITNFDASEQVDPELFKTATILTTLSAIPTPEQAPELQFIQLLPAGVDHLLHERIFQHPTVQIATTSGIHAPQIAEWVVLQILSFTHHARYLHAAQLERRWVPHAELQAAQGPVRDMTSCRVGILGYGSIGRQVARVCHSMGSEILAFTASARPSQKSRRDNGFCLPGTGDQEGVLPSAWYHGLDKGSVHEFLRQDIDVLVVCLPLTDQTRYILGEEEFSILGERARKGTSPGSMVINVSRGGIIDQEALVASLKRSTAEGGLRCAALDVTDPEPLPASSELWLLENVVLHPHVSGLTDQHLQRFLAVFEQNLERWSTGSPLLNLVEKRKGY
ncbi:hypothetical protein BJX64DRAFT_280012 [Aspergillus heterothallicus]